MTSSSPHSLFNIPETFSHDTKSSPLQEEEEETLWADTTRYVVDSIDKIELKEAEDDEQEQEDAIYYYHNENSGADDDDDDDMDDENDKEVLSIPRSDPSLIYNEYLPRTYKYLIYTPSGGMSNQIMELENGLELARLLDRTLYVPLIASHSNFIEGYLKQTEKQTFPADKLLDFNFLSKYTRVIPLNVTLTKFLLVGPVPDRQIFRVDTDYSTFGMSLQALREVNERLIYLSGFRMWKNWFRYGVMDRVKRFVGYSPFLRELSVQVAREELGKEFYAIHGRLGDQASRWGARTSQAFVQHAKFKTWDKSKVIYLASDNPRHVFFNALRKSGARIMSMQNLTLAGVKKFSALFPNAQVRRDMVGVLDKLICIQAIDFLGTWFSTFTWDIERYRADRERLFPEMYRDG